MNLREKLTAGVGQFWAPMVGHYSMLIDMPLFEDKHCGCLIVGAEVYFTIGVKTDGGDIDK